MRYGEKMGCFLRDERMFEVAELSELDMAWNFLKLRNFGELRKFCKCFHFF